MIVFMRIVVLSTMNCLSAINSNHEIPAPNNSFEAFALKLNMIFMFISLFLVWSTNISGCQDARKNVRRK